MSSTSATYYNKGLSAHSLNKNEEAISWFDKAIQMDALNPLYYCVRGRALRSIGRQKEAFADFKKAQELLESGRVLSELSMSQNEYLTRILNSVLGLQKDDERAGIILEQLDQNNRKLVKFVENLKALQLRKEQVITDLLAEIEKKDVEKLSEENIKTIWQLKEDYERFSQEMKEELIREMDDLYDKFDTEIGNQIRVKDYFTAFIRTFNSVSVASQAIESGQFQFGLGSILSAFASFAPLLPSEITSVDKLLSTEEMRTNIKKMLEPFSDSGYLNAVIGKTAYKIVLDKSKREQISSVTNEELDERSSLLEKVSKFCEQMSEPIDIELYKKLYNTPAARLGHIDANYLIQESCEGRISIERVQEKFGEKTLKKATNNQVEAIEEPTHLTIPTLVKIKSREKDIGKGKCCSIF